MARPRTSAPAEGLVPEPEPSAPAEGLVRVWNGDQFLDIHEGCLADHARLGWLPE